MRNKLFKIIFCLFVFTFVLFIGGIVQAEVPASIQEVDKIQNEAFAQLDDEMNVAKDDLTMRKSKEIQVVEDSAIKEDQKPVLIKKIENKYTELNCQLEKKYSNKKDKVKKYYTQMKADLMAAMPPSKTNTTKNKEVVFVPPQKLIGKWKISGQKYVGTLKFISFKGVLVSKVRFFMFNKWDDLFNLTYDGHNVAFDYENPYGEKLHFEGAINPKANKIQGDLFDLKTDQVYSWNAYR